jgi:hypothetical protein
MLHFIPTVPSDSQIYVRTDVRDCERKSVNGLPHNIRMMKHLIPDSAKDSCRCMQTVYI